MKAALFALGLLISVARADTIRIVAAENFYGGIAAQIAGPTAQVTSILSNPNQDPHEFTTNASTAKAVADADIVIYNGLGYDAWMDKLLGTPGKKDRTVICVAVLIGAKDGDNPHLWYDPRTIHELAAALADHLCRRLGSPSTAPLPDSDAFMGSLQSVLNEIDSIKAKYGGTPVTATEPVFGYMSAALGFKMFNYGFQVNVMNDTEPSAAQTAAFEKSLRSHTVKLLFYNSQVTDPTTERLKKIAQQSGIPIIGVTETQPPDRKTYADWMLHELDAVQAGLAAQPH